MPTVTPDELVVAGVLAMRFLVPLAILRYPLPGICAAILADAADGAIFDGFTSVSLENYQHYDKALDIYYMAIAYAAVLRNWTDPAALAIGRFLWYYRLAGVALFALTDARIMLFLFPAAFEYFFIFYEVVRLRWNPEPLNRSYWLPAVAGVVALIKLPQEYWVHIAQQSTNDWVKETVFGMDPSTPRLEVIAANPWVIPVLLAIVALAIPVFMFVARYLPAADHPTTFDANTSGPGAQPMEGRLRLVDPVLGQAVLEKIALVTLVSIVFAAFLPGVNASPLQMTVALSILVVGNASVSSWFARRGTHWRTGALEFLTICAVNGAVVLALESMSWWTNASLSAGSALFYVLLLSLLISLHDRYRQLRAWWLVSETGSRQTLHYVNQLVERQG